MALIVSQGKYKLCACYLLQEDFIDFVYHFNTSAKLVFQQQVGLIYHLKKKKQKNVQSKG